MDATRTTIDGIEIAHAGRAGAGPAVVLIHGLGAAKEAFDGAFVRRELRGRPLLAADLVGFGDSARPDSFDYRMARQAELLLALIDALGIGAFFIVAHSMGGIVGLHLALRAGERLRGFVNAEGNLTLADCTLSSAVIRSDEESFVAGGFARLQEAIAGTFGTADDAALERYLATLARCGPRAFHRSAVDTVAESAAGTLVPAFCALRCARLYLYGERNRGRFPGEQQLRAAGLPVGFVADAGHAMADENPAGFYGAVADVLREITG